MNSESESSAASEAPVRKSRRGWYVGTILVAGVIGLAFFARAVRDAGESARDSQCRGHFGQLTMALHTYHDFYGCFPPAFVAGADGKPMHSWRVLILPFLNEPELYKKYRFDEPWDGPHNRSLSGQMPAAFRCPDAPEGALDTNYAVVGGPGTIFPDDHKNITLTDIPDGTAETILLVEIATGSIPWMEPRDLNIETMSFHINDPRQPCISSPHPRGPGVAFADRITAYRIRKSFDPVTLRALVTIDGGEKPSYSRVGIYELSSP